MHTITLNRPLLPLQYYCARAVGLVTVLALANIIRVGEVRADVHVRGAAAAVEVATSQASITEVLSALKATFHIRYRTSMVLDDVLDGTYEGSLRQVMSRVLAGYNYVMINNGDILEVTIIGKQGEKPLPAAVTNSAPMLNPTDWRRQK